ncbi:hypothetical protein PG593_08590 [Riemerella anatipestifer]|nr:hypothetical protein [Riemerella anatipestifer]
MFRDRSNECIAVVVDLPNPNNVYFEMVNAYNPYTGEKCTCRDMGRSWFNYIDDIEVGDTIIKRKGELTFYIHKKDTIITHYWECNGKVYK